MDVGGQEISRPGRLHVRWDVLGRERGDWEVGEVKDWGFHHILPYVKAIPSGDPAVLAVAGAQDTDVLQTCVDAARAGIARSLLFGDGEAIREAIVSLDASEEWLEIRHSDVPATDAAVAAGRNEADILMKGFVSSGDFLRAVLGESSGLRSGRLLSHVGFFDVPSFPRLLGMTDGGINISPDFEARIEIVGNAADLGRRVLGRAPRIALVSAVEKVQTNMPVTLEWAALAKMGERGEFGDAFIDGPLGLDIALDPGAARGKGISGEVAGRADIIVVPDIQCGNIMGKTLTYLAAAPMAGLVVGARVPVVLNSRADSPAARLASVVVAISAARGGL